ncbi:MAG: tRNA (adenosine(37)-N6)-threonylcarbamoyltransferase complex dimerization subunit type 1 TsaB, partial [Rhodospirillaceae bacterium]|nr:tRNA (adenosine(37)-N6)-threonylcarbamoyltransferase complex dimerization subunit type 1 TsaB [Rhodospirillaceae bacterium]
MTAAGLPLSPLLALDTAGAASTVAVMADGRLLAGDSREMTAGHAEVLPGQVQAVLAAAGLAPIDISLFGATVGPGSFTGVRIGLAALAGLALGAGRPMVGITRFALYAACLPDPGSETRAWVCLDSRRGPVFLQAFDAVAGAWQ